MTSSRFRNGSYTYPRDLGALLELGYLVVLEQGVFLRVKDVAERHMFPDLSDLAGVIRDGGYETVALETLLEECELFAASNELFYDAVLEKKMDENREPAGEESAKPTAPTISEVTNDRDGFLALVETGPDSKYEYPSQITALLQLGFLVEFAKGIFLRVCDPLERARDPSLGLLAFQIMLVGLEAAVFDMLVEQGMMFDCSGQSSYELYWDERREAFWQARSVGQTWSAANAAAFAVDREANDVLELCDVSDTGLNALLGTLPASYASDRNLGVHKAPRIDNSDPYKAALTVNGRVLKHIIVDTGCEMVIAGRAAARKVGIKPSMMHSGAVALRCADERVTKAFDRTIDPVAFVFNPGTEVETTVMAHVVVTHSDADTMLLGMSVIGRVGLVPNPYKGTLKYYVDWETRGSRSARLACLFGVDLGKQRTLASSGVSIEVIEGRSALVMPIDDVPQTVEESQSCRLKYQAYHSQLFQDLTSSMFQNLSSLSKAEADSLPPISREDYRHVSPLKQDIVDISALVSNPGLVVVELCGGLLAATEALVRSGVKIQQLHVCEIDSQARRVALARLKTLSKIFPELLASSAFDRCFCALPQDIRMISRDQVRNLGNVDLLVCGFPCQGFSRAARRASGLRDARTALFLDMVRVIQQITSENGDCGWVIENVDASDHPDFQVQSEFNEVVKGVLGEGLAFDAVSVGSYAHRYRRFWTNLIPASLLQSLVDDRFLLRPPDQSVQDVLEPGRWAQVAKHDRAPGPHSVNIVGKPLRAFATFVTFKDSDAFRSDAQSCVRAQGTLEPPTVLEKERAMGYLGGTSNDAQNPLSEASRLRLLGGSMDMYQLTFLFGAVLAFQTALLNP